MLEFSIFMEVVIIVAIAKLTIQNYNPPINEFLQSVICISLGTGISLLLEPTINGFVTGIISSGVGFYGETLVNSFKDIVFSYSKKNKR